MKANRTTLRRPYVLLSLLLLAAATIATAQEQTDSTTGLTYTIANGEATVTGITSGSLPTEGKLVIPETLGGVPVTSIGESAFAGTFSAPNTAILEIKAPSVQTVSDRAFEFCTKLKSLTNESLPKATTIANYTFENCLDLTDVFLPVATTIGTQAFWECITLNNVELPEATTIGRSAFGKCNGLTAISFPLASSIGDNAFYQCYKLVTVYLPNATFIGNYTFYHCFALTTLSLPEADSIGLISFFECSSLKSISLPKVDKIGSRAFSHCKELKHVYLGQRPMLLENPFDPGVYRQFDNTHADLTIHHHPEYRQHFDSGNWASLKKNEVVRPFSGPVDIASGTGTATLRIRHAASSGSNDDWAYAVERSTDLSTWADAAPTASGSDTANNVVIKSRTFDGSASAAFYRVQATPNFMN